MTEIAFSQLSVESVWRKVISKIRYVPFCNLNIMYLKYSWILRENEGSKKLEPKITLQKVHHRERLVESYCVHGEQVLQLVWCRTVEIFQFSEIMEMYFSPKTKFTCWMLCTVCWNIYTRVVILNCSNVYFTLWKRISFQH